MSTPLTKPWTAEITWDHWYQHRAALAEQGLSSGCPSGASDIDQPIAESATCPRCQKPMRYFPMYRAAERRGSPNGEPTIIRSEYRAFAVCLGCNVACEF